MAELIRPELTNVDGGEVSDRLQQNGITGGIQTWVAGDGMHIVVDDTQQAAATTLLNGWTPTSTRNGTYQSPLPAGIQSAVADFKQFMAAPNGSVTVAQRDAILKDIIRCLNFLNQQIQDQ